MLKKNFALAENVSKVGYVPYQGITQAALTPQMESGMRGVNAAASAFGLPNSGNDLGLPEPITNEAGFRGYSPYAQYQQEIAKIPPGQSDAIESFVIDPMTGMFSGQSPFGGPAASAAPAAPAFQNTGQTDDAYLRWISANYPNEMTFAQRHGMSYMDPHGGGGGIWDGRGEVAETPDYGVVGQPGSLGAYGDNLDAVGQALGGFFGGIGQAFGLVSEPGKAGADFGGQGSGSAGSGGDKGEGESQK